MKSTIILLLLLLFTTGFNSLYAQADLIEAEKNGHESVMVQTDPSRLIPSPEKHQQVLDMMQKSGVLLIVESSNKRVMAFDPYDGHLINENFIPADPTNLSTPIEVLPGPGGNSFLISDQIKDGIQKYKTDGTYDGWFAPAGGPDPTIVDNVRGMEYRTNGNILLSVGSNSASCVNRRSVVEIDQSGTVISQFVPSPTVDPFDMYYRASAPDYLLADILDPDYVRNYDLSGTPGSLLITEVNFPEQIHTMPSGNILVAVFSSPSGVHEYTSDGTLVGIYDVVTGNRGVYALGNGNILTTNGSGIYEIDHSNNLIETEYSGISGRFISYITLGSPVIELGLKINMEGPFNGTTMNTSLNSTGNLPLAQPYNTLPWNYTGSESVAAIPSADIVDWILVELRDAVDAGSANNTTIIAQQAAFLMSDGNIKGMDGTSNLQFSVSITNNLFAVVWHRNHLGIMSAFHLTEVGGIYTYDFTNDAGQVYGGTLGHKELATGIYGMISGDGNADNQINSSDKINVWQPQAGTSGYLSGDFNLDSQVATVDKITYWKPNSGRASQIP